MFFGRQDSRRRLELHFPYSGFKMHPILPLKKLMALFPALVHQIGGQIALIMWHSRVVSRVFHNKLIAYVQFSSFPVIMHLKESLNFSSISVGIPHLKWKKKNFWPKLLASKIRYSRVTVWALENFTSFSDSLCEDCQNRLGIVPSNASICDTDTVLETSLAFLWYLLSTYDGLAW